MGGATKYKEAMEESPSSSAAEAKLGELLMGARRRSKPANEERVDHVHEPRVFTHVTLPINAPARWRSRAAWLRTMIPHVMSSQHVLRVCVPVCVCAVIAVNFRDWLESSFESGSKKKMNASHVFLSR